MADKTKGIVLQHFRYSDTSLIAKIFTEQSGLQSYLIKGAFSKHSRFKPAFFQPMNLVEFVESNGKQRDLRFMVEIGLSYHYQSIQQHPLKNAIVMFMSELLHKSLPDQEPDQQLFSFISDALIWLDLSASTVADFPLYFMLELTRYLGFYPKLNSYQNHSHFDLMEGVFKPGVPGHPYFLTIEYSALLVQLSKTSIDQMADLSIKQEQRRQLLQEMVHYYQLHVPGFKGLQSHEILRTVLR
jgi:DNA repair protein RecO (recombination protein O)